MNAAVCASQASNVRVPTYLTAAGEEFKVYSDFKKALPGDSGITTYIAGRREFSKTFTEHPIAVPRQMIY